MTNISLGELFTEREITRMVKIITLHKLPHARLREYITPLMQRIDERTGQKNDVRYMAYAAEYALRKHMKETV